MQQIILLFLILSGVSAAHADEIKDQAEPVADGENVTTLGMSIVKRAGKIVFARDPANSKECPAGNIRFENDKTMVVYTEYIDGAYKGYYSQFLLDNTASSKNLGNGCREERSSNYRTDSSTMILAATVVKKCDGGKPVPPPVKTSIALDVHRMSDGGLAMNYGYAEDGKPKMQCKYRSVSMQKVN